MIRTKQVNILHVYKYTSIPRSEVIHFNLGDNFFTLQPCFSQIQESYIFLPPAKWMEIGYAPNGRWFWPVSCLIVHGGKPSPCTVLGPSSSIHQIAEGGTHQSENQFPMAQYGLNFGRLARSHLFVFLPDGFPVFGLGNV